MRSLLFVSLFVIGSAFANTECSTLEAKKAEHQKVKRDYSDAKALSKAGLPVSFKVPSKAEYKAASLGVRTTNILLRRGGCN